MIIAAFDPGLSGAVAICWCAKRPTWAVRDLPTMGLGKQIVLNGAGLAEYLRDNLVDHTVVERVHSFPGGGVAGMFRFGTAFGQILGVVQALGIPYELAEPAKWKRDMRLPGGAGKGEASRLRALELFPRLAGELARKRDHNRAEALLLARWWVEKHEREK
ncbi:MAG: hypothetical protein K8E66_02045 [Phycisphaerales bacterium]|nr:hypothetical protein [Phycisphaerales bacterium]